MTAMITRRQGVAALLTAAALPILQSPAAQAAARNTDSAGAKPPMQTPDLTGSAGPSLEMFGPCGQGDAEADDKAFRRAFAFLAATRRAKSIGGNGGRIYPTSALFVPPGDYVVRGAFGHDLTMVGLWCVPGTVSIRNLDRTTYFFDLPNRLDSTYISGIQFIGGKGAFRQKYIGNNVAHKHIIEKCIFFDYTECAIVSNSEDMPYWIIRDNQFYCEVNSKNKCKGVALGGLVDNLIIQNNSFLRNDIHLQIGPFRSGNVQILNNDFLSFEKDRTDVDIWFIANDESKGFGTNAGQGTRIAGNKFGNENITTLSKKSPRILVSASSGLDRESMLPDYSWKNGDDGRHWLLGLSFHANRFSSANIDNSGGTGASLMRITIEKLGRIHWAGDNFIDSGNYRYLFHHDDQGQRRSDRSNTNWEVRVGSGLRGDVGVAVLQGISNRPVGPIDDPFGLVPGPTTLLPQRDPNAKLLVDTQSGAKWLLEEGIERQPEIEQIGDKSGSVFIWRRSAAIGLALPDMTAFADCLAWIVATIKGDTGTSGDMAIRFTIANVQDWTMAQRTIIRASKRPLTVTTPFIVPRHSNPNAYQLRLEVDDVASRGRLLTVERAQIVVGRHPEWISPA